MFLSFLQGKMLMANSFLHFQRKSMKVREAQIHSCGTECCMTLQILPQLVPRDITAHLPPKSVIKWTKLCDSQTPRNCSVHIRWQKSIETKWKYSIEIKYTCSVKSRWSWWLGHIWASALPLFLFPSWKEGSSCYGSVTGRSSDN